jgi:hypothetical protein
MRGSGGCFKNEKHLNLLETLTWKEFKLWLDGRFTPHHLVFQNGMEVLEFTQGDNIGFLATYV